MLAIVAFLLRFNPLLSSQLPAVSLIVAELATVVTCPLLLRVLALHCQGILIYSTSTVILFRSWCNKCSVTTSIVGTSGLASKVVTSTPNESGRLARRYTTLSSSVNGESISAKLRNSSVICLMWSCTDPPSFNLREWIPEFKLVCPSLFAVLIM